MEPRRCHRVRAKRLRSADASRGKWRDSGGGHAGRGRRREPSLAADAARWAPLPLFHELRAVGGAGRVCGDTRRRRVNTRATGGDSGCVYTAERAAGGSAGRARRPTLRPRHEERSPVSRSRLSKASAQTLAWRAGRFRCRRRAYSRIEPAGPSGGSWCGSTARAPERGAVTSPDENALGNPELAPDGKRVAVQRAVQGDVDVWLIDIGRGVPTRFTFDAGADGDPLWSPDGSRVVFRASRKLVNDLFERPSSSVGAERLLLETAEPKVPLAWSHDGRFLLYASQNPNTGSDLWALSLDEDLRPSTNAGRAYPVVQTGFDEWGGQFSPNGRWVAYESNESGLFEVYVRTFPDPGGQYACVDSGRNTAAMAARRERTVLCCARHSVDGSANLSGPRQVDTGGGHGGATLRDAACQRVRDFCRDRNEAAVRGRRGWSLSDERHS